WHEDTFVDFETGLNTAIKRLRETLGDSADNPTFIDTLPRRGYKFIAPVERLRSQDGKAPGPAGRQETRREQKLRKRCVVMAGVAVLLLSVVGGTFWYSQPQSPTVTNSVRITNDGKAKGPFNPLFTDGVHLYFMEGLPRTSGSGIAQVSAAGGETTWITTTLKDIWAVNSISPDGSELLIPKGATGGWVQEKELLV